MKLLVAALLLVSSVSAASIEKGRVGRTELAQMELELDRQIKRALDINDPFDLIGSTRGVYLENYGAVFTAEVNLVIGPAVTPFRPEMTREQIESLHQKKLRRLPMLKQKMREVLQNFAVALPSVPANEQIVIGVSLFYYSWENKGGLPTQILMQAPRQALLELGLRRAGNPPAEAVIRTSEL